MSTRMKIDDATGAADGYLHAVKVMLETVLKGEGRDYCSLNLLLDSAQLEIAKVQDLVDAWERRS